jgi:mono/diheme cytochrome c family protein
MKIQDKTLLITGGTGSFGNAVLKRFLNTDHFKEIRIFSRDETKQDDMRNQLKNDKLKFYIGDVRDYSSVERAMRGVDYVFHAAALKHVPIVEENVTEGKRQYEIYCVHCHGASGQGDGSIVAIGKFPPPPSYSNGNSSRGGAMRDLTDGKIFHTISYGINLMGAHASQINPEDRWRIVMYIHQLQNDNKPLTSTTTTTTDSTKVKP